MHHTTSGPICADIPSSRQSVALTHGGVLNLNDVPPQREPAPEYDLDDLSARLGERAREWVPELFPRGRIVGDKLRLANIEGDPPKKEGSCIIELKGPKAGNWKDFGTDDGGGPLSTLARATGLRGAELMARAAEMVATARASPTVTTGRAAARRKRSATSISSLAVA